MTMEKGNIYLGTVRSVAVSYRAAFVEYGSERDGFLPFDEIENKYKTRRNHDTGERIVRRETPVVVQVKKAATDGKGALLTTRLSLAGDYVAYMPDRLPRGTVSRRIDDESEKERLQQIASDLAKKHHVSLIVRTEASGLSTACIEKDLKKLIALYQTIEQQAQKGQAPMLLHREKSVCSGGFVAWIKSLFAKK